jgi:hypothetical protein
MSGKHVVTPTQLMTPRVVSLKELREKLLPFIGGWAWADDALNDLWLKGAPDPNASMCPNEPPCPVRQCPHIKRILLPNYFAQWWKEVCKRQGYALTATQAVKRAKL